MAGETDSRIADLESAYAATEAEIEGLKEAVREARHAGRVSPLALWGPALASGIALASLAGFILDERIGPIAVDVRQNQKDIRDLSGLIGEIKQLNVSQAERLDFHDRWLEAVQSAGTKNREMLNDMKANQ